MKHTCHLPPCKAACPPRHLFCRRHWAMVPSELQQAVYDTVGLRGSDVDDTWAPWWRAQAAATVAVLRQTHPEQSERIDRLEQHGNAFAAKLESKAEQTEGEA